MSDDEVPVLERCQHRPIIDEIDFSWNTDQSGVALEAPCRLCGLYIEYYIDLENVDWDPVIEISRNDG